MIENNVGKPKMTAPGAEVRLHFDDLPGTWGSLQRSVEHLTTTLHKAPPRVRDHYAQALETLDARLTILRADMEHAGWISRQLTHLMGDWLHTCWIPERTDPEGKETAPAGTAGHPV